MDGSETFSYGACLLITAGLSLGACAEFEPEPDPVPMSMYDSPVVANGIPDDSSADRERAPAEREESDRETRTAEASEDGEPATDDRPTDSSEAKSDTESMTAEPTLASQTQDESSPEPSPDSTAEPDATSATTTDDTTAASDPGTTEDRAPTETIKQNAPSDTSTDTDSADRPTTGQSDAARYITAIYELNGVSLPTDARTDIAKMYRHCRDRDAVFQSTAPKAGDMVFFHNVHDANDDGRNNDWYTWVGLVERIDSSGTVHLLGYRDGAVDSLAMNLNRPDDHGDGGEVLNTRLRQKSSDDPPFTQYLAGQLFAGYCSLLGDRSELLVVDNWEPGMDLASPQ